MNDKMQIYMKWMVTVFLSTQIGNVVMNFFYLIDTNVWIARSLGAIFAGLAGYLIYTYWIKREFLIKK